MQAGGRGCQEHLALGLLGSQHSAPSRTGADARPPTPNALSVTCALTAALPMVYTEPFSSEVIMRRLSILLLLVLLIAVPAFSQAKRPFTFKDMMKLKRVGE